MKRKRKKKLQKIGDSWEKNLLAEEMLKGAYQF